MQCPDCGYMMTAFDKECPRCKTARARKASPSPKKLTENPPRPKPVPLAVNPVDTHHPAPKREITASALPPILDPALLACVVCGSDHAQKVSAICQQGTWTTHSRGYAVGVGSDGYGHAMMMGGPTGSTSHGQTGLASLLMPPPGPRLNASWTWAVVVPIVGYFLAFIVWFAGPLAATLVILATTALWLWALIAEGTTIADRKRQHQADTALWQQGMQVWSRLFYCGRCDHVYDPQTRQAAQVPAVRALLTIDDQGHVLPGARAAGVSRPLDSAQLSRFARMSCGVGAAALAVIWGVYGMTQVQQKQMSEEVQRVRAPLTKRFQASQAPADSLLASARQAAVADSASSYTLQADMDDLTAKRASVRQELDGLADFYDEADLKTKAGQIGTDLDGAENARQTLARDLQAATRPVVAQSDATVDTSGTGSDTSGTGFTMRTEAGGGSPPDTKGFQGAPTTTTALPPN